jgi:cytochrome c oxidase subunit II
LAIGSRTGIAIACVILLALAAGGVLLSRRKASTPVYALEVTLIGHQYWWEIRYRQLGIVAANELHIPVGSATQKMATHMTMSSADIEHSFSVPALRLKADLDAYEVSTAWVTPETIGLYTGECVKDCGAQHPTMQMRVYVDSPEGFRDWVARQKSSSTSDAKAYPGKAIFERTACVSCHTVAGTIASGRFGPDLTHVGSRATIAAGLLPNTKENLRAFLDHPTQLKPGCLMPPMHLSPHDLDAVTDYIASLN